MANIVLGNVGSKVQTIQSQLNKAGYDITVDGEFGIETLSAVNEFQKSNNISENGIVGLRTLSALANFTPTASAMALAVANAVNTASGGSSSGSSGGGSSKPTGNIGDYDHIIIANTTFSPQRNISFYGLLPDELPESHSTEFENVLIKSRSNPIPVYAGSSARTLELSIDIHEDYLTTYGQKDIVEFIQKVKSLTYPSYKSGAVIPPRLYIRIGDFIKMKAICNTCSITWRKPMRQNKVNGKWYYVAANISLSLSEYLSQSYSVDEVWSGGDLERTAKWMERGGK